MQTRVSDRDMKGLTPIKNTTHQHLEKTPALTKQKWLCPCFVGPTDQTHAFQHITCIMIPNNIVEDGTKTNRRLEHVGFLAHQKQGSGVDAAKPVSQSTSPQLTLECTTTPDPRVLYPPYPALLEEFCCCVIQISKDVSERGYACVAGWIFSRHGGDLSCFRTYLCPNRLPPPTTRSSRLTSACFWRRIAQKQHQP